MVCPPSKQLPTNQIHITQTRLAALLCHMHSRAQVSGCPWASHGIIRQKAGCTDTSHTCTCKQHSETANKLMPITAEPCCMCMATLTHMRSVRLGQNRPTVPYPCTMRTIQTGKYKRENVPYTGAACRTALVRQRVDTTVLKLIIANGTWSHRIH